jgi:hypothetical protein
VAGAPLFQLAHQGLECSPFLVWLLDDAKPFFVFYTAGGKAFYNGKICGEKEKCWPELDRLEICVRIGSVLFSNPCQ